MSELKTLKDILPLSKHKTVMREDRFVVKDLRQEAIKWIKDIQMTSESSMKLFNLKDCDSWCSDYFYSGEVKGKIITWVKHFFNITDKDLK